MKKLNNKGITTIEVLICFVLTVVITVSLYSSITSFNQKRTIESYKQQLYTYKNILTKEMQDDFIKVGLTHADFKRTTSGKQTIYTVNCDLKDGTKRTLVITQLLSYSSYHTNGLKDGTDDYFMIEYGIPGDLIKHPLPDLGTTKIKAKDDVVAHVTQDLSINNIQIDIKDSNVLSIYIGFYHPELTTRYAISISAPINYVSNGSDSNQKWEY